MPLFSRRSSLTGKINTRQIDVSPAAVERWIEQGPAAEHVQRAFPDLSADDREFIAFGNTPEEYDELVDVPFPDQPQEDDDD